MKNKNILAARAAEDNNKRQAEFREKYSMLRAAGYSSVESRIAAQWSWERLQNELNLAKK